ncbi:hypothetical protein QBC40DRAFT_264862 [Triangularia verruculosa]|uniref:Uncharacterized protein n=1 Tax=Triangularia verruculosa TaxID=2587418 RepID=A0AAN6XHH6_9PEZI|nr:hypothetical protein QBC40DRAFT_264862 [Triangularia verruculosa]
MGKMSPYKWEWLTRRPSRNYVLSMLLWRYVVIVVVILLRKSVVGHRGNSSSTGRYDSFELMPGCVLAVSQMGVDLKQLHVNVDELGVDAIELLVGCTFEVFCLATGFEEHDWLV